MRFRDLGPLLIEIGGVDRTAGGRKPGIILSRLLANVNERVPADALVDALSSDGGRVAHAGTMESHIWRLRNVLEPGRRPHEAPAVLISDAGGYRLLALLDDVDSTRLEQISARAQDLLAGHDARRALLACDEALGLWRGQPYESTAEQDWAAPVVARLGHMRALLQELRIDALLGTGATGQALGDLELLLAATPYREHLWASKMLALYRLGRPEEALSVYHEARAVLRDDLGLDPGPELRALQARIQDHDPGLLAGPARERETAAAGGPAAGRGPRAPAVHLPRGGAPLLGRDGDLARLGRLVAERPLVTITGVAGAGKTRLAIEVARQSQETFDGGIWFVDLTATGNDEQVTDVISSALSVEPAPAGTTTDAVAQFLRRRRALLVLDNCEHVLAGAGDVVDALLAHGVEATVLATSREPLGVSPEVIWTLGPLPVPRADEDDDEPAVQLFLARARDAAPTLTWDGEADRRLVRRICASVDGLPLAIELAAARVRTSSLSEIARQVGEDPSQLRRLGRGADDHRHTIRETIDWSYRLLPDREQRLHRRLSVLPGTFTLDAALAVGAGDTDEAADTVAQLAHRSMVVPVPPASAARPTLYTQLATVRGHARRLLDAAGEAEGAVEHRDAWIDRLLAARPRLGFADAGNWYERAEDDYPTVRASLEHRLGNTATPEGARAVRQLTTFWRFRGSMIEGRRWHELAIGQTNAAERDRAAVRLELAVGLILQNRTDLVRPWAGAAVTAALAACDPADIIDVGDRLATLAHAFYAVGELEPSRQVSDALAEIAKRSGDHGHAILGQVTRYALDQAGERHQHPDEAEQLYETAARAGSLRAALMCSMAGTRAALRDRDAEAGGRWVTRSIDALTRMGGRHIGGYLEAWASFAAMRGSYADAVTAHAAARQHFLRAGLSWPRGRLTDADMAAARDKLDREAFDRAWLSGEQLSSGDAVALMR